MIYLDSSALLKLLHDELESTALAGWLDERAGTPLVSSELAKVEVIRACRRLNAAAIPNARALFSQLDLVRLSSDLVDEAAAVGDPMLRSLDAIHLATALSLREELSAFVAYDLRLADAASDVGLSAVSPGR